MKERDFSFRTYRESNYQVVVPFICIGFEDFLLVGVGFLFSLFIPLFFKAIFGEWVVRVLVFISVFFSFLCYWIARNEYKKDGRVNVLMSYIDYYFGEKEEIRDGRSERRVL